MSTLKLWTKNTSDHDSFSMYVEPHIKQMYRLAYRLTGQRVDAEDLVQDVVLKLYPRLSELQKVDNLSPWLMRIVYRHFIDKQRRIVGSPVEYTDEEQSLYALLPEIGDGPVLYLESELTQETLQQALDQLNDDQRLVILLHDVEGYTLQEIHLMQDVAIGTLKSRLHRGQFKLREILCQMERFDDAKRVNE